MIEDVTIKFDGRVFTGWEDFSFDKSKSEPAASWTFRSSKNPANLTEPTIRSGRVEIYAGDDLLDTGNVDRFDLSADPSGGRVLNLTGRSVTGDLIDSSVIGSYREQNTLQVIKRLVEPFGIEIEADADGWNSHRAFTPEYGKSVMEAIYDGLQLVREKTASITPDGKLRIWDAANIPSAGAISAGSGVETYSASFDNTQKFSNYRVAAQDVAFFEGLQARSITAETTDASVGRYRPKVIFPSADMDTPKARNLSERVARRASGRAESVNVTVTGWRNEAGQIWTPNVKVWLDFPELWVTQEMVLTAIRLSQSLSTGTTADLTFEAPGTQGTTGAASTRNPTAKAKTPEASSSDSKTPARQIDGIFNDKFVTGI